jgi:ribosomal protein S18 acetylase RimI-like enzyme
MSAAFRFASLADVPAVLEHQRAFYAAEGYAFDEAVARAAIEGLLGDSERGRLWVLVEGDPGPIAPVEPISGYLAVTFGWSLEWGGRDAFVDELYLAPSHRGRGIGRTAIALAEDACRAAGVRALHLEVERENVRGRALYAGTGFADADRLLLTRRLTPTR